VGDVNLSSANFNSFKSSHDVFLLGVSDSQCDHCCFTEGILYGVRDSLRKGNRTYGKVRELSVA
jgi:hypothetical protein